MPYLEIFFSPISKGCNNLIRDFAAKLLSDADEILNDFNWYEKLEPNEENKAIEIEDENLKILNLLTREKTLDEIMCKIEIETQDLLGKLMELEIAGFIKSVAGGKYKRIK